LDFPNRLPRWIPNKLVVIYQQLIHYVIRGLQWMMLIQMTLSKVKMIIHQILNINFPTWSFQSTSDYLFKKPNTHEKWVATNPSFW
jgi:hypothetical protein